MAGVGGGGATATEATSTLGEGKKVSHLTLKKLN